jgi:hypothetical protein
MSNNSIENKEIEGKNSPIDLTPLYSDYFGSMRGHRLTKRDYFFGSFTISNFFISIIKQIN